MLTEIFYARSMGHVCMDDGYRRRLSDPLYAPHKDKMKSTKMQRLQWLGIYVVDSETRTTTITMQGPSAEGPVSKILIKFFCCNKSNNRAIYSRKSAIGLHKMEIRNKVGNVFEADKMESVKYSFQ